MESRQYLSEGLLPCPCCGGEPVVHDREGIFDCGLMIECPVCGLRTLEATYYTKEGFPGVLAKRPTLCRDIVYLKLQTIWNLRYPTPPQKPRQLRKRPRVRPVTMKPN